jgi:hypothetical protein
VAKGWNCFAEAARLLKDELRIEWSALGPMDPAISTAGLDHVKFHGPWLDGELGTWLQNIDVAVPACRRNETFGMTIDEVAGHRCQMLFPSNVPSVVDRYGAGYFLWGDSAELAWCIQRCAAGEGKPRYWKVTKTFADNCREYLTLYRILLG